MPARKPFFNFISVIWILVAAAALGLLALPLIQNVWAYYQWQRVPCELQMEKPDPEHPIQEPQIIGYRFDIQGTRHAANRLDFWEGNTHQDNQIILTHLNADHICYVSPSDPTDSVLNLDVHKHLDHAVKPLTLTVFLVAVAALLTWYVRRQNRQRSNRS